LPVAGAVIAAGAQSIAGNEAIILATAAENVLAGETYTAAVVSKRYQFAPRTVTVSDELSGLDFVADPEVLAARRR